MRPIHGRDERPEPLQVLGRVDGEIDIATVVIAADRFDPEILAVVVEIADHMLTIIGTAHVRNRLSKDRYRNHLNRLAGPEAPPDDVRDQVRPA